MTRAPIASRGMRIALAMCLLATLFNSLTTGESSGPTYYTSTSEVRLSFFGTDESGRVVNHLTTQDFAVVDEGSVIREFRSFATSTDTNVRVIVLVDLSESVLRAFRQEITGMLNLVDQTQWKDGDELSIISFRDADLSVLCARNCLRQPVGELLRTLTPGGSTPLYDALIATSEWLGEHRDSSVRPVLILLSDGRDTISRSSGVDAMQAILSRDARIYSLDLNSPRTAFRDSSSLRSLAEATGGRYFHLTDGAIKVISSVLNDQHASYTLTYNPRNSRVGFHSVVILPTRNLHLQFHSRRFYYYDATAP